MSKNEKGEKAGSKEAEPKPVRRVGRGQSADAKVEGIVNGQKTQVVLDTGADISIVPEDMVAPSQLTGESVGVRPFGATAIMVLPMAETTFEIGNLKWTEVVAVSPMVEGEDREVLCALDITSERGLRLILMINEVEQEEVTRIMAEAQVKAKEKEKVEEEACVAREEPKVKTLVPNGQEVIDVPGEEVELEVELEAHEKEVLCSLEEDYADVLCFEKDPSDDEEEEDEVVSEMRAELEGEVEMDIPPVKAAEHSREHLVEETVGM